jgi:hypothetical protein
MRIGRWCPTARRGAPLLVAVWLASWLLLAVQPCCEAMASVLPHEHAAATGHSHGDTPDFHRDPGHYGHSVPGHAHCGSLAQSPAANMAMAAVASDVGTHSPAVDALGLPSKELTLSTHVPPLGTAARSPGSSEPAVYLRTARLRL